MGTTEVHGFKCLVKWNDDRRANVCLEHAYHASSSLLNMADDNCLLTIPQNGITYISVQIVFSCSKCMTQMWFLHSMMYFQAEMPAHSHQANSDIRSHIKFSNFDASITTSQSPQHGLNPNWKEQKLWAKEQTFHEKILRLIFKDKQNEKQISNINASLAFCHTYKQKQCI